MDIGKPENVVYCVDDLRFINEISTFRSYGNTEIIRLNREDGQKTDINDPSEKELDNYKFEYYIENDGTLSNLKDNVRKIFREILDKKK